ncbi:MAG: response regulator transcription factor [Bacteroidetes bacterium]|nr:response regulator transcription factor [Bacteroidota bacterium]
MSKGKILIADDEQDILDIISYNLKNEGFEIFTATNGVSAIELAKQISPDLIILDIMMPLKNGIDVCKFLRSNSNFKNTIIVFLTAMNDENFEVKGLQSGADDYITKPVSTRVLISKVNALFRRIKNEEKEILVAGDLIIDRKKYIVTASGKDISLPKKEFELLSLLASSPGKVFLRNDILEKIWGTDVIVGDRTIDVHIRKIRQKIDMDCISTVKGVGYKFEL